MPLVLASNEVNFDERYAWKDITGHQYHFPNGYRRLIQPGEKFVYYRGQRRADGSRKQAEYFGRGTIGEVWRDPDVPEDSPRRNWAWYCEIDEFWLFVPPVPAKIDGVALEQIDHPNLWRNGVRQLSFEVFERILSLTHQVLADKSTSSAETIGKPLPSFDDVRIPQTSITGLLVAPGSGRGGDERTGSQQQRRSHRAKLVGDRAEEIALAWLKSSQSQATGFRWLAKEGLVPGWDMEFVDADGRQICVEVKGAVASGFANFELTARELAASRAHRDRYWLVLVSDCTTLEPSIEVIPDPASLIDSGRLFAEPLVWRLARL